MTQGRIVSTHSDSISLKPRVDILYLAFNRLEFTIASLNQMLRATDPDPVNQLVIYDDGSTDGTQDLVAGFLDIATIRYTRNGSPVGVMNDYLSRDDETEYFAKIDSDVMLPHGWLDECISVMDAHPELDLLGIEAVGRVGDGPRTYKRAEHVGGIGLFRRRAFKTLPEPQGRFGFTAWQARPEVVTGWIQPSLNVVLLDRVPVDPWLSLSNEYEAKGWQRPWPKYSVNDPSWKWVCTSA